MQVRLATRSDIPAILEISNEAAATTVANFAVAPEPLAEWQASYEATHQTHPWLVATQHDLVIGFAKASPWSGRCAYDYSVEITVYVATEYQGGGVGRALYARLFEILQLQGYTSAIAGITLPNPASVRLHESFGMKQVATFQDIGWKWDAWHDVGYWQGQLQGSKGAPQLLRVSDVTEG